MQFIFNNQKESRLGAYILLSAFLAPTLSFGGALSGIVFWRIQKALAVTTTAQTVPVGLCSGVTTVQTRNAAGAATNVTSNLTVNLATSGSLIFYSDSNCATPVTSVTILSGTSSASFYFIKNATGAETMTLTATAYAAAAQTETGSVNAFVWTGGGTNANWSTGANWSGGAAPGASNVALLNGTCSSNCSPTISANISIGGVRIESAYSGTITQNSGVTITAGASGWFQNGGTFTGGNSSVTLNGDFTLLGGTYSPSSATTTFNGNYTVSGSPTFNAGSSTLYFVALNGTPRTIKPGTLSYANVTLGSSSTCYNTIHTLSGTMSVQNITLSCNDTYAYALNSGTIDISGNLTIAGATRGSATIKMSGNGTITGNANTGVPNFTINTPGSVSLSGTITVYGDYTYTAGTVNAGTSSLIFNGTTSTTQSITPGSVSYYNVTLGSSNSCYALHQVINGTLSAKNLTTTCGDGNSAYVDSGTVEVSGDLTMSNYFSGTGLIKMIGSGTITGNSGSQIGNLTINTSGTYALSGTIGINENYTYTAGTINAGTSTLLFNGVSNTTLTITPGSVSYYNVTLGSFLSCYNLHEIISGTMNVQNLSLSCGDGFGYVFNIDSGAIQVAGNLTANGNANGTGTVTMTGGSAATISQGATIGAIPTGFSINKSAGATVTLSSNVSLMQTGQNLTLTSGNLDMAGYALTVKSSVSLNSNTSTKNGGVLTVNGTVAGTGSLYGGTVNP